LWQEQSRATGQVAVRTFDLPGPFILETRCGNRASALRNRSSSFRRAGCYPSPQIDIRSLAGRVPKHRPSSE
jgi:hypothetical protein